MDSTYSPFPALTLTQKPVGCSDDLISKIV